MSARENVGTVCKLYTASARLRLGNLALGSQIVTFSAYTFSYENKTLYSI